VLDARATARELGGRWRVQIETDLDGVEGERSLDGDSCSSVASATALILAMTLDPEAVRGAPSAPPAPPPATAIAVVVEDDEAQRQVPAPEQSRIQARLRPIVVAGLGALPGVAAGLGAALTVQRGRWSAELFGLYLPDRRHPSEDRAGAGGDFRLLAVGAAGCYALLPGALEVAGCIGAELDHVGARGYGVAEPGSGAGTWVAPLANTATTWWIGERVALRLDLQAVMPLSRPRFVLLGVGPVWRPPVVNGRAGLGLMVAF
jgi:hypothetical protein